MRGAWLLSCALLEGMLPLLSVAGSETMFDLNAESEPRPAPIDEVAYTIPLRDLVDVRGVRENQLVGYGIVVGLAGTGDGTQARFTIQSLANALQRMGVAVPPSAIRVRNAAAVMVTANLPPFARAGARLDVTVSSIGDAKALTGGTLLMTPLHAADGQIYGTAQGAISLGGGFSAGGGGASVGKNHTTVGSVPAGGLVEREVAIDLAGRDRFDLALRRPDFNAALRIERALAHSFGPEAVHALDAGTVRLIPPQSLRDRPVEFLALALDAKITPETPAKVVLNERTGTVVLGGDVRLGRVAVTHGNLTISVVQRAAVSQPEPLSRGETVVTPEADVVAEEEPGQQLALPEGAKVEDLVAALHRIGVTPRDMIAIFEAIRAAGALHAELQVI